MKEVFGLERIEPSQKHVSCIWMALINRQWIRRRDATLGFRRVVYYSAISEGAKLTCRKKVIVKVSDFYSWSTHGSAAYWVRCVRHLQSLFADGKAFRRFHFNTRHAVNAHHARLTISTTYLIHMPSGNSTRLVDVTYLQLSEYSATSLCRQIFPFSYQLRL